VPEPQQTLNPPVCLSGTDGFEVCPFGLYMIMAFAAVSPGFVLLAELETKETMP
jgi:hypothetical protein